MRVPPVIVVMGVSGAGKSTFGAALAASLGRAFLDADDLHPAENKAKMAAGIPLDDADRAPWLAAVSAAAREAAPVVVACSALKRAYREAILSDAPGACFVELVVPRAELKRRLAQRTHEFMSPALLDSQLATLEPLGADEPGLRFDDSTADGPALAADRAVRALREAVAASTPCFTV
ncbi:gluconokinase [Leifsonia sp. AG29]|uniref:gluconokinase n=1 Tax=Leifsonia sp. AG29 TaxID=2598860 RepID=UPI00131CEB06|nr:gluconokinase [Leifsonia sp. AG29]